MNRRLAFLLIVLFWAAVYLPGLGSKALRGEEARRSLPAIEMLETGDWLVPHLNGAPYLRKPPLLNWAIAASLYVVRDRDEWVVRLPSVLAMLAMASVVFWTGVRWLSTPGAFAAAIISLSGIGLWEKGNLAEIDAIYSSLTGIAFALWLAAWIKRETGWRLWLFPGLCLGLATLAKGPLHLLLFYAVVIPLLVMAGEKRQIWSGAHLAALGLGVLIVAAWAIPYLHATASLDATSVWTNQMQNTMGRGKSSKILVNELGTLANGLPWVLFVPLFWWRKAWEGLEERRQLLVRTARWLFLFVFFGLMLIPGMLPRYTLPLSAAVALTLALVIPAAEARVRWGWKRFCVLLLIVAGIGAALGPLWVTPGRVDWAAYLPFAAFGVVFLAVVRRMDGLMRMTAYPALAFAAGVAVYAAVGIPRFHEEGPALVSGRAINEAVPRNEVLHIVDPGYEPAFFYIDRRRVFVQNLAALAPGARYVLVAQKKGRNLDALMSEGHPLGTFPGMGKRQLVLMVRDSVAAVHPVR